MLLLKCVINPTKKIFLDPALLGTPSASGSTGSTETAGARGSTGSTSASGSTGSTGTAGASGSTGLVQVGLLVPLVHLGPLVQVGLLVQVCLLVPLRCFVGLLVYFGQLVLLGVGACACGTAGAQWGRWCTGGTINTVTVLWGSAKPTRMRTFVLCIAVIMSPGHTHVQHVAQ